MTNIKTTIAIIIAAFMLSLLFTALVTTPLTIFLTFILHAGLIIYLAFSVLMEKDPDSHGDEYPLDQ